MAELTPTGEIIQKLHSRLAACEGQIAAITDSLNLTVQTLNSMRGIDPPKLEEQEPELLDADETMPGWYECRFQTPFGVCKIGPVQTPEAGIAGAKAWMQQQEVK